MDYSDSDLNKATAELQQAERRREWMLGVVATLKARSHHARVAERQLAAFAAMTAAMRKHRKEIEDAIVAQRTNADVLPEDGTAIEPRIHEV